MWIVTLANNTEFLKNELFKRFSNSKIYFPKIRSKKNRAKNILGNYIFFYNNEFQSINNTLYNLRNLKGLKKILFADKTSQKEILDFINFCKLHEDTSGYIKNSFFKENLIFKGRITNGPFSNYIFDILSKDKKRIKALIGDIKFSISDNSNFCYSPL